VAAKLFFQLRIDEHATCAVAFGLASFKNYFVSNSTTLTHNVT
jgi:hypothetical protein